MGSFHLSWNLLRKILFKSKQYHNKVNNRVVPPRPVKLFFNNVLYNCKPDELLLISVNYKETSKTNVHRLPKYNFEASYNHVCQWVSVEPTFMNTFKYTSLRSVVLNYIYWEAGQHAHASLFNGRYKKLYNNLLAFNSRVLLQKFRRDNMEFLISYFYDTESPTRTTITELKRLILFIEYVGFKKEYTFQYGSIPMMINK